MSSPIADLHAIVPAGGAGTRLWPLSRTSKPKFLLDLTGSGRTLIQQTWDRLEPLTGPERIHIVTGVRHADQVAAQLPGSADLIAEPAPRDSMPAIGLAAAIIARDEPEAIVGSFAADHVINDVATFGRAVAEAADVARDGLVATIGLKPTFASTGFGYINFADSLPPHPTARTVREFVEKPQAEVAERYLADGTYLWNAGMFITKAEVLLGHLEQLHPVLHDGLREIAAAWGKPEQQSVLERVWPDLTAIPIDTAVAEPISLTGGIAVVPGTFDWTDLGDFDALAEEGALHSAAAITTEDDAFVYNTTDQVVTVAGVPGVVVVVTDDAILVTSRDDAQLVKKLPALVKESGREDLV